MRGDTRPNRSEKKYKRLKTIIYRCQGPLGNHMLCAELMRFYLVWVCVFFPSFSLWIIHLYLSHLLYHALFFCWCFFRSVLFIRFNPTMQLAMVSSDLRELFPFYQYVDSMNGVSLCTSTSHTHFSLIPHLDAWSLSKLIFRMSKYFFWTSY